MVASQTKRKLTAVAGENPHLGGGGGSKVVSFLDALSGAFSPIDGPRPHPLGPSPGNDPWAAMAFSHSAGPINPTLCSLDAWSARELQPRERASDPSEWCSTNYTIRDSSIVFVATGENYDSHSPALIKSDSAPSFAEKCKAKVRFDALLIPWSVGNQLSDHAH